MHSNHQEATCGLQVCQHPLCWSTNRQAARGLLPIAVHGDNVTASKSKTRLSDIDKSQSVLDNSEEDDETESLLEGLPTVTILNMLDDYGYDKRDVYETAKITSSHSSQGRKYKTRKSSNLPPGGIHIVPRLTLKSLASQSVEDVTAPANTPLQSAHGFGDHSEFHTHTKRGSYKQVYTETPSSLHTGENISNKGYKKIHLDINIPNVAGRQPKRMLVWCPAPKSKRLNRLKQSYVGKREVPPVKEVSLPLQSVPEYKTSKKQHKALRSTIPKKIKPAYATTREMRAVRDAANVRETTSATPQEISQLRKVPVDVLIRVLHQAEENGIITKRQTNFLLAQVTGKPDKLPSIRDASRSTVDKANQTVKNETVTKSAFEAKNLKILGAEEARILSPRTVSVEPVFKMDEGTAIQSPRLGVPTGTRITNYTVTNIPIPDPGNQYLRDSNKQELNMDDNDYDEKLRDLAEENLRSIGALGREVSSPKKTPVKYVATVLDGDSLPDSPIKPFHYPRTPREMFLGPVSLPSPPTPTERDSLYDAQVGGSTMLVNASSTGPPTIKSVGENRSSCSSELKTYLSHEMDGRVMRMAKTSTSSLNRNRQSPFGSSNGQEGWPQISEEDYLRTAGSSELAVSPLPSFTEEEMRAVSRNESADSAHDESSLADKFQNLQHGEIRSPAPPPPSPEPMSNNDRRTVDSAPTRTGGASTALGLTTLTNKSGQSSAETGIGSTPTPVVSSITSNVETPQGRYSDRTPGGTPAINETSEVEDGVDSKFDENPDKSNEENIALERIETNEDTFETTVSPDVAKEELETEMEKLHMS
uniref:uncharacterized protein LOC120343981 isoform X1 n=1 Tax=Styela clava TaxID=7725 RepID=UPI00193ADB97|nr:uncharacterized protein LOC120343981 isoform X1 [Styela clava]